MEDKFNYELLEELLLQKVEEIRIVHNTGMGYAHTKIKGYEDLKRKQISPKAKLVVELEHQIKMIRDRW